MSIKKILHLIRYFLIFGLVAFVGYVQHLNDTIFLVLVGPCLYIAYNLQHFISTKLVKLHPDTLINYYAFLLPVCLVYYTFVGFQLKQLLNERFMLKWLLIVIFIAFLIFIHHLAYQNLSSYITSEV